VARTVEVESSTARVLVIDLGSPGTLIRDLEAALRGRWEVISPAPAAAAPTIRLPSVLVAAFLVVDHPVPERIGEWAAELRRRRPEVPLLVAASEGAPNELARLQELGVSDFVLHPFRAADVHARVLRLPGTHGADALVERLKARLGLRRLVGHSAAFVAVVERIPPIAACDANVLITGETGTGKEVFARAIHHLSRRSGKPFVPVNCGALPLELVENELFGHTAEAFTGAAQARQGLIHEAEGGTLFLDEIDSLPAASQVKLLRLLQDKEYRALGSTQVRRADLRLIAATNARVEDEVERGRVRRDLYYRLAVLTISLPPLRERTEDVLLLSHHFLARHAAELGRPLPQRTPGARQALLAHDWPGNVRELEHVMQRALLLAADPQWIDLTEILLPATSGDRSPAGSFQQAKREAVDRFERRYIERLLLAHGGNISHAARAAGKNRRAFFELIRKHAIDARRFCPPAETAAGFGPRRRPVTSV
jgi:DNA-binding NtrC family response regulator